MPLQIRARGAIGDDQQLVAGIAFAKDHAALLVVRASQQRFNSVELGLAEACEQSNRR
jgi:hypothetical protein